MNAYESLAAHLDALPNGYPATERGTELRILEKLFSPEQAELASQLGTELETAEQIAVRLGEDAQSLRDRLKSMARSGLVAAGRTDGALGFKSLPFVVGIYEMQLHTLDAEMAILMDAYFREGFDRMMPIEPQFHRVIPSHEAGHEALEIHPFESAAGIIGSMRAWAVQECICRKQKGLIGQPCRHPLDVCLVMAEQPNAFDEAPNYRALTREQAMGVLKMASEAGLVHTVSNTMEGVEYICNCCTCSCGILRGMAELGLANVVARSPFVNKVERGLCTGCEACLPACQFGALSMEDNVASIDRDRCMGCGVCVLSCTAEALVLERRPAEEVKPVPATRTDWDRLRSAARGL